jgi:hypothetical protein
MTASGTRCEARYTVQTVTVIQTQLEAALSPDLGLPRAAFVAQALHRSYA